MAAAQLFRQDSGAFPGRGMRNEHILRTGSHSESFYHDDKLVAQAPLPQPAGRHRLANSFGQADFAKMFEKEFGKSDGCAKVELSSQHSGELPSDCSKQHQSAFGLARQGSPVQHLYENGARCTVQITATGSPLAGGRPSPRFTAGKLEAATSGELRAAFLPSGDFSRTLLNSDSFGRRGSLGLTGLGAESPIASSVPMPASALQKAHFEAARGHFLADMDPGAMSPLSPCSTTSCRRLQELYGFFQTGGPLGRTNTEGQDELLAAVAVESSNGDFDLGDPAELQKLVSSDAMPSSPLPPISAGISASMPLQPISAPGAIVPSASLAPPVPAVQIVLANHDPADQELPPTPPLLRMLGGPPSPTHRQPGASTPSSPNRRQPSLPGDFLGAPSSLLQQQPSGGVRRTGPALPAGVSKRTSSNSALGRSVGTALEEEVRSGSISVSVGGSVGTSSVEEGPAPKPKPKRTSTGDRRPRRMTCNYCRTHVTPQWRCGPDGPRTLCNACGVRWGKGKLEIRETSTATDMQT